MTATPHMVGIVDDDSSVRMGLGNLVRSLGYRTALFASAEEFIEARTEELDCLICDINMPGMNGWDLLTWMRVNGRAVPTIMITAFGDTFASGNSFPEVTVFKKPLDADLMVDAIRDSIASRN